MIVPDVNLLSYAINRNSPFHDQAREWWDAAVSAGIVALCWPTVVGFLRLATNRRVLVNPLSVEKATGIVDTWLARPDVPLLVPTSAHRGILPDCCEPPRSAGIWPRMPTSPPTPSSTAAPSPPTTRTSAGFRGYAGGIRSGLPDSRPEDRRRGKECGFGRRQKPDIEWHDSRAADLRFRSPDGVSAGEPTVAGNDAGCELTG